MMVGLNRASTGAFLAIAARRPGGRDVVQLVDDDQVVDVPGVKDVIDVAESIEDLRPELAACFRDVGV